MRLSVGGLLVVELGGDWEPRARAEFDPCPVAPRDAGVDIEVVRRLCVALPADAQIAGDGGDGWLSALAGQRLHLVRGGGGACVIDGAPGDLPLRITADAVLPTWVLMREVVRPLLQLGLAMRGAAIVHAAAVARPGVGILIAGWSESGKTEVALALAERGWSFVADKWSVLDGELRIAPFPIGVGVRAWVLESLPQLRTALPATRRARLRAAARTSDLVARAPARARSQLAGVLADTARRACAQAERLSLPLSAVQEIYRGAAVPPHPPLTHVVVLRTVAAGRPAARPLEPASALPRLRESAAYERRHGLALLLRRRFAGGEDRVAALLA
ncbi:MAG: hypothetical protein KY463_12595, partial [Actinobacteria bacterium]|nr:hypothetical protein [Actinomycetota bacterium]